MTTEEIIQYDLDAGRFGGICSNEDTFKVYVFRKIEEARNEGIKELLKLVIDSLPKLKELKSTEEQVEIKDWECIGYNFCFSEISEIKEIISNLINKIK